MLTDKRFEFSDGVPNYFPATIPWDLVGTMGRKVLQKEFDYELAITTTYVVGCSLTITAINNVKPPTVFNSSNPFAECPCTDAVCNDLADQIEALVEKHKDQKNLSASVSPDAVFILLQLAMKILSMFVNSK